MSLSYQIVEYDEVTSTNDLVKQAATEGAPEGLVVCAKAQTAGYGRRGHTWESGPGSLYMSLLLRPDLGRVQLQTLPLVTATAVRRAIASFLPPDLASKVLVKWPNDVVFSSGSSSSAFRKMCGISVEQKSGAVCVGIGVNVYGDELRDYPRFANADAGSRNQPTYLSDLLPLHECPTVAQVRDCLLVEFGDAYDQWTVGGFAMVLEEYLDHFAFAGKTVRIDEAALAEGLEQRPAQLARCVVEGVTADGYLLVREAGAGPLLRVASGSATIVA